MKNNNYWYAVMKDREDTDWGTGSCDLSEAIAMARRWQEDYPDVYIVVIEDGDDPVAVDEIANEDFDSYAD